MVSCAQASAQAQDLGAVQDFVKNTPTELYQITTVCDNGASWVMCAFPGNYPAGTCTTNTLYAPYSQLVTCEVAAQQAIALGATAPTAAYNRHTGTPSQ